MSGEGPTVTATLDYSRRNEEVRLRVDVEGGREKEMRVDQRLQLAIMEAKDRAERRCRRDGVTDELKVTISYLDVRTSTDIVEREQLHLDRDSEAESEGFGAGAVKTPFYQDLAVGGLVSAQEFFDLVEQRNIDLEEPCHVQGDQELLQPLQMCTGFESSGAPTKGGDLGFSPSSQLHRSAVRGRFDDSDNEEQEQTRPFPPRLGERSVLNILGVEGHTPVHDRPSTSAKGEEEGVLQPAHKRRGGPQEEGEGSAKKHKARTPQTMGGKRKGVEGQEGTSGRKRPRSVQKQPQPGTLEAKGLSTSTPRTSSTKREFFTSPSWVVEIGDWEASYNQWSLDPVHTQLIIDAMMMSFSQAEKTYELPTLKLAPLGLEKLKSGMRADRLKPTDWKDDLAGQNYYYAISGQHNAAATKVLLGTDVALRYNFERWPTHMVYFSDEEFEGYFLVSSEDNKKDLKVDTDWTCAYPFLKKREAILVEFEKQGMDATLWDGSRKLVGDASLFKDCPPYMGYEDDKTIKATEKLALNKKLSADRKNKVLLVLTGSKAKSMEVALAKGVVHVLWKDSGDVTSIAPFGVDPLEAQMRVTELEKAVGTTKCHTEVNSGASRREFISRSEKSTHVQEPSTDMWFKLSERKRNRIYEFLFLETRPRRDNDAEYMRHKEHMLALLDNYHDASRKNVNNFLDRLECLYFVEFEQVLELKSYGALISTDSEAETGVVFDTATPKEDSDSEDIDIDYHPPLVFHAPGSSSVVEFHRFTEGGLRRSPARTQEEPPASEGPLRELETHLDISRWRASPRGEEHGEQAEEVPREEVPREEVPQEEVPREEVPREEVPREEVQDTQRERGLGDEGRRVGKEVIEVGEDTAPQTPAVGLRLEDAPRSTRRAGERLQREEAPLPSSKKAPSPEGRAERRRERAVVRRETLTLIDRHLEAYALEHPDLEEPAPAEPRQEPCQPEKEMEARIPKRFDLRTRERAPAGETAEEKRARRTRRIDEIWQERQRLEAAGELPEQQQERQRSEAAGALPGKKIKEASHGVRLEAMEMEIQELRALVASQAAIIESLRQQNQGKVDKPESSREGEQRQPGQGLSGQPSAVEPRQEPPMGRVIMEPEEARTQRQAEREAFEFRAPTKLATLPVAAAGLVIPLAVEEGRPPSSSEPAQGSAEDSVGVLLGAVHTMQEEVSLFSPEQRIEEPLEREMGIEAEGVIEGGLQRLGTPEYGPEEIEEQAIAVPGETLERRP
ncbi:hypothetical protein CBR_g37188 [Chara braunii]|uniref:Uncharacterized protein n=1 Tax=Chara braunii TaxID=69332 RepID=A0A388LMB7_CHABU|nr:hypothetical protein CBR_g37188 [Chara braunii]|eukprot:GBG83476.1 hypothetical protein CBR_g37188 [Chara braunii]